MLLIPSYVFAGKKLSTPMYVNVYSKYAYGQYGSSRNSNVNSTEYIECINNTQAGGTLLITCSFVTSQGNQFLCNATGLFARIITATKTHSSYVKIYWDAYRQCASLTIINSSVYPPIY